MPSWNWVIIKKTVDNNKVVMSRPSVKMIDYRFETLLNYFNEILQTFDIKNDGIFSLCVIVIS